MENKNEQKIDVSKLVEELSKAGSHFGYSRTRRHPSVKDFIFGSKNRLDIIDLEKSAKAFGEALDFISSLAKEGKQILFVGNKKEAQKYVEEGAKRASMPYVNLRWIGGSLTNFTEIRKRIARLEDLLDKKSRGLLDVYTKKERLLLDREIARLEKNFSGIVSMKRLPAAMIVVDSKKEYTAVDEAKVLKIPVVSLSGTDTDITEINYPVVLNDSSILSISFFIDKIVDVYKSSYRKPLESINSGTPSLKN